MNRLRFLCGSLCLLIVASCSTPGAIDSDTIPDRESAGDGGSWTPELLGAGKNTSNPAVSALLKAAAKAYNQTNYESSAAFTERAIRISPSSAQAYFMLAQIRFAQAQYDLSQTLLKKSDSLTEDVELQKAIREFMQKTKVNR